MAYKNLINQSNAPLSIELVTRAGSDPSQYGPIVPASYLPPGASQQVQYGDANDPYLNGVVVTSSQGGSLANGSQMVTVRGSAWDNMLNTNNTLTFSGVGGLNVAGSNT